MDAFFAYYASVVRFLPKHIVSFIMHLKFDTGSRQVSYDVHLKGVSSSKALPPIETVRLQQNAIRHVAFQ